MRFFTCRNCHNVILFAEASGVPVICCGEPMSELEANTVDASQEKHVPVITCEGQKVIVFVGETSHPMQVDHYISWIVLETKQGAQGKSLKGKKDPYAEFYIAEDDQVVAAYCYCNIHGLWMSDTCKSCKCN